MGSTAEMLALLVLDDQGGGVPMRASSAYAYAVVAAGLVDLLERGAVTLADDRLTVVDPTPRGDALQDLLLERMVADRKPRRMRDWVQKLGWDSHGAHVLRDDLVARGVLVARHERVLGLFPVTRRGQVDPEADDRAAEELAEAVRGAESLPAEAATLLVLLGEVRMIEKALPPDVHERAVALVKRIRKGDPSAVAASSPQAAHTAVAYAVAAAAAAASVAAASSAAASSS